MPSIVKDLEFEIYLDKDEMSRLILNKCTINIIEE